MLESLYHTVGSVCKSCGKAIGPRAKYASVFHPAEGSPLEYGSYLSHAPCGVKLVAHHSVLATRCAIRGYHGIACGDPNWTPIPPLASGVCMVLVAQHSLRYS